MRKFNLGYFIKEGFVSIFSHGLMSFAAVCMIVACLIIMGSFSLLAVNVDEQLSRLEEENEFLVYVDESFSRQQIEQLMERVRQVDNVAQVDFISADEAKAKFLEGREHQGLYANLPDGVIRDRLSVRVADLERFTETVDAVRALPGVANYRAESKVAEGFVAVRNAVTALAWVLIGILAAVSLFIISNTIRLTTFDRREEIAIMRMVGATNGFIRWPFVYEGFLLGLFSAVIGFFLQWGLYEAVARGVASNDTINLITVVPFETMWTYVAVIFAVAGMVIGVGGSLSAIRKFLQV